MLFRSSLSSMRGGQPSTTQPIAGPWLSPKVVTRKECPNVLNDMVEELGAPTTRNGVACSMSGASGLVARRLHRVKCRRHPTLPPSNRRFRGAPCTLPDAFVATLCAGKNAGARRRRRRSADKAVHAAFISLNTD